VTIIVVAMPVAVFFVRSSGAGVPSALARRCGSSMTPLGAAWAIPGAAVSGSAAAAVVVAVLTVIALGPLVRARAVAADDDRTAGIRARARGLGWFALTPSTPAGGSPRAASSTGCGIRAMS
jgi:ABC-2 type transport system permease protein